MDNSIILQRLETLDIKLFATADDVRLAATTKLARIVHIFPHYTAHDISHSMKALEICEWLAGEALINQLNAPELFVLFSAICLHDVGMAVEPYELESIKESELYREFEKTSGLSPEEALAEWVRRDHHLRSAILIRETYLKPDGVGIRDKGLAFATALVCESHCLKDLNDFNKYDPCSAVGTSGLTLRLPLLAILLRLSDVLHVTEDRTPLSVIPYIRLSNSKTKMEWSKHLSSVGVAPANEETVRLSCICDNPNVHREILRLCDYINGEFNYSHQILKLISDARHKKYPLSFKRIEPSIQANGYEPWLDLTFKLDREGIIRLLTGERIYESPGAVVKELIMNAVDTTRQKAALSGRVDPIALHLDTKSCKLSITDQGIGMDKADIVNFLLDLGKCFYRSDEYGNRYQPKQRIESVSEFGIGFASCFLVADHVVLETLKEGADPILLDMYDLMGFAAAKKGNRTKTGTTITLHLKPETVKQIEGAMKGLQAMCPHLEVPLIVNIDGMETTISSQPFCFTSDDLLVPFFRDREPDFIVEHRYFDIKTDSISGCISILFNRENGVMVPGSPGHYKLQTDLNRRVSQLGFSIPAPQNWPECLFRDCTNTSIVGYDLDLYGEMRLELDPSRTKVLPSPRNLETLEKLDKYFVSFIVELHNKYWRSLSKDKLFKVYRQLSWMLRFQQASSFILFNEVVLPLTDLFMANLPLETISYGEPKTLRTWDEIRVLSKPVVFFQYIRSMKDSDEGLNEVSRSLPGALIIIEDPSSQCRMFFSQICSLERVFLSDLYKTAFQILRPWPGNAAELKEIGRDWIKRGRSCIIPFIPAEPYAIVSSNAQRVTGVVHTWLNISHPKITALINAVKIGEQRGSDVTKCNELLTYLCGRYVGMGRDPEYIKYLQQQQHPALDELVIAGVLTSSEADKLLLSSEDFVPWEKDW